MIFVLSEHGLVRPVRWTNHTTGVSGGQESTGLLRGQSSTAHEGQQQPERGAAEATEGGAPTHFI